MSYEAKALGLVAFVGGGALTLLWLTRPTAGTSPTTLVAELAEECYGPSPDLPDVLGPLGSSNPLPVFSGPISGPLPRFAPPTNVAYSSWDFTTGMATPSFQSFARMPPSPGGCTSCR